MNMRKIFIGISIAGVFAIGLTGLTAPALSSAQSLSDLQDQVKSLLGQIANLTDQLNELRAKAGGSTGASPVPSDNTPLSGRPICTVLYRNLDVGARGGDVSSLQEFLHDENYLLAKPTGYYGILTKEAAAKWQASESVPVAGAFGPTSRERIKVKCGDLVRMSAEPASGEAPLVIRFTLEVGGMKPYAYTLNFGDGTMLQNVPCPVSSEAPNICSGPLVIEHRYQKNAEYTAILWRSALGGLSIRTAVAKTIIRVSPSAPVACTLEYNPVCGRPAGCENTCPPGMYCTMMCKLPEPKTYSNKCFLAAEKATLLHEGECTAASGTL